MDEKLLKIVKGLLIVILSLGAALVTFFIFRKPSEISVIEEEQWYSGTSALERPQLIDTSTLQMTDSVRAEFKMIQKGKELFEDNCKSCHSMHERSVGPELYGIGNRRDRKWIHHFVRNSRALIKSGDSTALKLYKEYGMAEMTAFPDFTDEQIDAIIKYTGAEYICR